MNTLCAAIARCDITPPLGTLLFGYPSERRGNVVADGLNATALVLQSGEETAVVIALDWAVLDEEETAAIGAAISDATGISARHVTLCCSHTHSGPPTVTAWGWSKKDVPYLEEMRARIAEIVAQAQKNLQPVRIGIGVGTTDAGINRREIHPDGSVHLGFNESGPRDDSLSVVRFEGENGTVAGLVHLSAHPTSRGLEPSISRDWPGVMMDRLETITGATTLFINGSFGDVAPRTTIGGVVGDGEIAAREVGLRAANDAIAVWREIKDWRDMDLNVHLGEFQMPHSPLASREDAGKYLEEHPHDAEKLGEPGAEWNYWNAVQKAHCATLQSSRTFRQTLTRIGPLVIVPFGGEIFSDIALRLKKASPFAHTLCAGSTNGSHGYYVTREARARGGYEVWVARAFSPYLLADNIDDVLVQENLQLLQQLAEKNKSTPE